MARELPYWIQVLQALSTPAIALLAVIIGVMQWRTSHQRAALDLFDKRWEIVQELRSIIAGVMQEASVTTEEILSYARAADRASFLFGPEVIRYLETVRKELGRLRVAGQQMRARPPQARTDALADQEANAMAEISKFSERFEPLISRYMRMRQKLPWI